MSSAQRPPPTSNTGSLTFGPGLITGSKLPWAGPRFSDGACSHHVLLIDGAKGPRAQDVSQRVQAHFRHLQRGW